MRSLASFLKSKVALALLGACLIGGTSAVLAARTAIRPQPSNPQTANNVVGGSTATSTAGSSSQATNTGTAGTPTLTITVSPTTSLRPTATATPQVPHLRGTITAIDTANNNFTITRNGVNYTVDVDSNTSFTGNCTTFSGLHTGWLAYVTGQPLNGNVFHAATVNSSTGDN